MMDTEAITAALNSFLSEHSIENRRVFIRRYWRAANSNRWPLGEQDMENHAELINGLFEKNDKVAYKCLKELITESEKDACVYPFFDTFAEMIDNDNSYIRTRGLLLISANAKWDTDFKIDEIIDKYLRHIMDDKPITARQCIKAHPNIAKFKPVSVYGKTILRFLTFVIPLALFQYAHYGDLQWWPARTP